MVKRKLTLSVDDELLKNARVRLVGKGESVSKAVEDLFRSIGDSWIEDLARQFGVKLRYISSEEVIRRRGKIRTGLNSTKVLREMREDREKRILGH